MVQLQFIANLLGMEDNRIQINPQIDTITKKGIAQHVLSASLSYSLEACQHCGVANHSTHDMIKYGFVTVTIHMTMMMFTPIVLRLRKQRYLCKHCHGTSLVTTPLVKKGCYISEKIKRTIAAELSKEQSMKLIAHRYAVSNYTVTTALKNAGKALEPTRHTLPEHLAIDEFKSVKSVKEAMSCIIMDAHKRTLLDILPDRKQKAIHDYFMRFPLEVRRQVKTVTMDMYRPYYAFLQRLFPNAKIIIDRFHLVQLLNRGLNSERIKLMNEIKTTRPKDYRKFKQLWKLILKNNDSLDFEHYRTHRLFDGLVTEKMMVEYLLSIDERFGKVYRLINDLKADIELHDYSSFVDDLDNTRKVVVPRAIRTTFQTLSFYLPAIENSLTYTLSNGVVEGTNNKIKNIKRSGYGYRSFQNLRYRILISQRLTVKDMTPRSLLFADE